MNFFYRYYLRTEEYCRAKNKAIDELMHMDVNNNTRKIFQQLHAVYVYESIRNRSCKIEFYLHVKHNERKLKFKYPPNCKVNVSTGSLEQHILVDGIFLAKLLCNNVLSFA